MSAPQLQLGYVAGAHGIAGAVRVKLFNPESDALEAGTEVIVRGGDQPERQLEVARVARTPGSNVFRVWFVGLDSRDAAEALRGRELWIDREQLPELADDEFYLADLVGLDVEREHDGTIEHIGRITGVTSNGAQNLLCIRLRGREWLLPAIAPFIIDIDDRRVLVDAHDELLPDRETS